MLDYLKYKHEVYKIKKEISKNDKFYRERIEKAKKNGKKRDEWEPFYSEWRSENYIPETDLKFAMTRYLRIKAEKYNIPTPNISDEDSWVNCFGSYYLNKKARFELNKIIRQELRERLEIWIPIITALTGLIGVLIGLISVMSH